MEKIFFILVRLTGEFFFGGFREWEERILSQIFDKNYSGVSSKVAKLKILLDLDKEKLYSQILRQISFGGG